MFVVKDFGRRNNISIPESVLVNGEGELLIKSSNCSVIVGEGVKLPRLSMVIEGKGAEIYIGNGCVLGGRIVIKSDNAVLSVGSKTTWMNVFISFHEAGAIIIGEDCMFSGDIRMDVSDMHSIIDIVSGKRINPAEDIRIGRHVWIGQGVFVTKGVSIGDHAIIGAKSVVSKDVPDESLAVGVPAKVIKRGVSWDRRRL